MSSVQFNCPHCDLALRVPERRAGTHVRCPSCKETVLVPDSSQPLASGTPPVAPVATPPPPRLPKEDSHSHVPAPPVQPAAAESNELPLAKGSRASNDPVEPIVDPDQDGRTDPAPPPSQDRLDKLGRQHRINLPRSIIYTQAILLGVVGMLGFMFGLLIGWSTSDPTMARTTPQSATVRGQVTYAQENGSEVDPGSTVILLPRSTFPSEKLPIDSLRPSDTELAPDDPTVQEIRRMGGDVARTGSNGQYHLRVPNKGSFYLLAISNNHPRTGVIKAKDLGEISRYFSGTSDLIGQQSYRWTKEALKKERTIVILFP